MKLNQTKISLLIFSALCVASFAFFSMAQENASSDKNIFLDSDQDGLSNAEEATYGTDPNNPDTDGDGYTDGIEIKSGYDPLKPAPGDKIVQNSSRSTVNSSQTNNSDNKNLTEELSVEVASLINEKGGGTEEISLEDLDSIVEKTTSEVLTFDDLPEVDESEIKIKKQNYGSLSEEKRKVKEKEDAIEYLTAVSYIIVSNSPQTISVMSDLEKLAEQFTGQINSFSTNLSDISYFKELADKGEAALDQLKEVRVPENVIDVHIKGIQLLKYSVSLKEQSQPDPNDPVSTILNLSKVQNLITLSASLMIEINSRFEQLGISEIPIDL